jgi:hypothetical protein
MHPANSTHFHAVRFYDDDAGLSRIVAGFLAEGLKSGEPALIAATPAHRSAILRELAVHGIDVDGLVGAGDVVAVDAESVLQTFMVNGLPVSDRFEEVALAYIAQACRGRMDCTVRVYGEMVDVLWKRGDASAAIRLEFLWNRLAATARFSLLCGYAMGPFFKEAAGQAIRDQHTHVIGDAAGHALPVSPSAA